MTKRLGAEFLGTAWLVFGGCGSAVLAAAFPELGIGFVGVVAGLRPHRADDGVRRRPHLGRPLQPGRHRRPVGGRAVQGRRDPALLGRPGPGRRGRCFRALDIATGKAGFDLAGSGFAANGYAEHSPGGYSLVAGFVAEVVLTFFFLIVILGSTDRRAAGRLRPDRDRPRAHPHPPGRHPRDQHVGEPGAAARPRPSSSGAGRSRSCGSSGWPRSSAPPRPAASTAG